MVYDTVRGRNCSQEALERPVRLSIRVTDPDPLPVGAACVEQKRRDDGAFQHQENRL